MNTDPVTLRRFRKGDEFNEDMVEYAVSVTPACGEYLGGTLFPLLAGIAKKAFGVNTVMCSLWLIPVLLVIINKVFLSKMYSDTLNVCGYIASIQRKTIAVTDTCHSGFFVCKCAEQAISFFDGKNKFGRKVFCLYVRY